MDLLSDAWLQVGDGTWITPSQVGEPQWRDLHAPRPDFRGAVYQFLVGLLQITCAPRDLREWQGRWHAPPDAAELTDAFTPWREAFLLENDGPAFMQDLDLPVEANQLSVLNLLIDAGSDSNRFFNYHADGQGMCEPCFAQALLTLQLNAPAGGRGVRTSLRGGGPLTTLLLPEDAHATLWHKLWLNVMPTDALAYPPVAEIGDVLPWMAPTRTSDGGDAMGTMPQLEHVREPQHVHPLQAYWSMPRRIRLDPETVDTGDCVICGAHGVRRVRHYRTRHGGTNYTGAWRHPLTPYFIDAKGQKPPISGKGHLGGRGYRDWLGLVLGNDDHLPDAAGVVRHYTSKVRRPGTRLWCFGFAMSNMKALCWYDSTLPVHSVEDDLRPAFTRHVKQLLDDADGSASVLHRQVKAAWYKRPGDAAPEPAVPQSFWQRSEAPFYAALEQLARIDPDDGAAVAPLYRQWLLQTRRLLLVLFDEWTAAAPVEELDLERVVTARAALEKELNAGKFAKPLWAIVNSRF